jgi:hypothetical protein
MGKGTTREKRNGIKSERGKNSGKQEKDGF